jgi:peptidoglycan/LPS O-acetylase OafA/YrhL
VIPDEAVAAAEPRQFQQTHLSTKPQVGAGDAALEYMPQLDGLRAIAVGAVVFQHFEILQGGAAYGVHLFFVLSGFLITGILMRSRAAMDTGTQTWKQALRRFYIRRVLRIFPLYYFVIFVGIAVNASYAREYAPWLLTYTINLKMAAQGWYIDHFAHFWSLAVEEQYYLVWPCLILLLPRRWLMPSAVIMTAIGPLYRLFLVVGWEYLQSEASGLNSYISTPTALDSLGIGSLIAIMMTTEAGRSSIRRWMRFLVPLIGLVLAVVVSYQKWWSMVLFDTGMAMFFGWLIYRASSGFKGIAGRVLGASPLVFIGRISYGIYVYHPLVPAAVSTLAAAIGFSLPGGVWRKIILIGLTLLVSTASWYSFERPITNLKRHFR